VDRLSKAILAMDGAGGVEFFAELSQWEQANASKKTPPRAASRDTREAPRKKLTYLETREWEQIEDKVSQGEEALEEKRRQLEMPAVVSDPARLIQAANEIDIAQEEVDRLYARWAELEAKRA
jgi:ATP-binding cassette subfamily F protein uup